MRHEERPAGLSAWQDMCGQEPGVSPWDVLPLAAMRTVSL